MNKLLNCTLKYAIFFLFVCSPKLHAQYSDCDLYAAYLKNDMSVWDKYIHNVNFNSLNTKERLRYLNYEYGYIGATTDYDRKETAAHITAFETHINALKPVLPEAQLKMYQSSLAAYKAMVNKMQFISKGLEAFNLVKEAYEIDSLDPAVMMLKASVDFYAPKGFGGNKQQALHCYLRARTTFEKKGLTHCNWNYMSCLMSIAQCYDKMGYTTKAIKLCEDILQKEPNFLYVKNTLLPELRKKAAEKK